MVAAMLGLTWLMPHDARAAISACRSDPKVYLSDGSIVQLSATIDAPPGQVKQVDYTVHVPAGASVNHVVYTGGSLKGKELLSVVADDTAVTYDTETVVYTAAHGQSVTAKTSADYNDAHVGTATASGVDEQVLTVHLTDNGSNE
jgi:hypothetical protein